MPTARTLRRKARPSILTRYRASSISMSSPPVDYPQTRLSTMASRSCRRSWRASSGRLRAMATRPARTATTMVLRARSTAAAAMFGKTRATRLRTGIRVVRVHGAAEAPLLMARRRTGTPAKAAGHDGPSSSWLLLAISSSSFSKSGVEVVSLIPPASRSIGVPELGFERLHQRLDTGPMAQRKADSRRQHNVSACTLKFRAGTSTVARRMGRSKRL